MKPPREQLLPTIVSEKFRRVRGRSYIQAWLRRTSSYADGMSHSQSWCGWRIAIMVNIDSPGRRLEDLPVSVSWDRLAHQHGSFR
jgi:hypothetical protein